MTKPKARKPVKATKRWAHVMRTTGRISWICDQHTNKTRAKALLWKDEYLTRVLISVERK